MTAMTGKGKEGKRRVATATGRDGTTHFYKQIAATVCKIINGINRHSINRSLSHGCDTLALKLSCYNGMKSWHQKRLLVFCLV